MEISGIDRLFALARELGVEANRKSGAARAEQVEAAEGTTRRGVRADAGGGVRISLSAAARGSVEPGGGPATPEAAKAPAPTARPTAGDVGAPTHRGSRRNGAAIAAYQRTATSMPGETVRIRA